MALNSDGPLEPFTALHVRCKRLRSVSVSALDHVAAIGEANTNPIKVSEKSVIGHRKSVNCYYFAGLPAMEPIVYVVPHGTSKADALIDMVCQLIESDISTNATRFPRRLLVRHQAKLEELGARVELAEHEGRIIYTSKKNPTMVPASMQYVGRG